MMGFDKSKFKFSEVFINTDGKSSGSGFVGVIGSLFCMLCIAFILFALYSVRKSADLNIVSVINAFQSALFGVYTLAGLYAGLLGLRKFAAKYSKDGSETIDASTA